MEKYSQHRSAAASPTIPSAIIHSRAQPARQHRSSQRPFHTTRYLSLQLRHIAACSTPTETTRHSLATPQSLSGKQETLCSELAQVSKLHGRRSFQPTSIFLYQRFPDIRFPFHDVTDAPSRGCSAKINTQDHRATSDWTDGDTVLDWATRGRRREQSHRNRIFGRSQKRGVGFQAYIGALQLFRRQSCP